MRQSKNKDNVAKENMNVQKFNNEIKLKINRRFVQNLEKYKQKSESVSNSFNSRIIEVKQALEKFT